VHAPLLDVHQVKAQVHQDRHTASKTQVSEIQSSLSAQLQRAMDLNSEQGASSWLTALPLAELGLLLLLLLEKGQTAKLIKPTK